MPPSWPSTFSTSSCILKHTWRKQFLASLFDDAVHFASGHKAAPTDDGQRCSAASVGHSVPAHGRVGARHEPDSPRLVLTTRLIHLIVAMLPVVTAFILQWTLWPTVLPSAWFIFYPAVFFSSSIGGLRAGLLATAISTVLNLYFFLPPEYLLGGGAFGGCLLVRDLYFDGNPLQPFP